jgi:hypothetical protein
MKCFARWEMDNQSGLNFRDQTILQFGDSWNLLANFILLNPGSAVPLNSEDQTVFLRSKKLPFFVEPLAGENYLEFSIDRLMRDLVGIFSRETAGGTIRIYNLFNLKNQHSGEALGQFKTNQNLPKMFAKDSEISFCNAPVVIATGRNALGNPRLKQELLRYMALANSDNLYTLSRVDQQSFSILKVNSTANESPVESYHPSYTCKYGNTTSLGDLKVRAD